MTQAMGEDGVPSSSRDQANLKCVVGSSTHTGSRTDRRSSLYTGLGGHDLHVANSKKVQFGKRVWGKEKRKCILDMEHDISDHWAHFA